MQPVNRIGLAAVLMYAFTPGLFADTIFTFAGGEGGTPFAKTIDGLTASFSSDGDPNGFIVGYFPILNPLAPVLLDDTMSSLTLTIGFSAPQASFSTFFGTALPEGVTSGVPFDLTAFDGASQVGSATATGIVPPGFPLAYGFLSFSGPAFDRVVLSAPTANAFWLDDVTVGAAATAAEPSSLSLLALAGVVGLCARAIPRRRFVGRA